MSESCNPLLPYNQIESPPHILPRNKKIPSNQVRFRLSGYSFEPNVLPGSVGTGRGTTALVETMGAVLNTQ